ncbi:competence protein ComJ [Paraburkholderia humisilvae]|uniref:competence protein ComJ n=1 Tax=Paraburkholderia humisilvae TaxID=627669 RepID=UPI0035EAFA87
MHAEAYPMALVFESRLEISMSITIKFEVSYSQLAVFASAFSQPYNDWSDRHVVQGFAWRPGRLDLPPYFATPSHTKVDESVLRRNSGGERYFGALCGCFSL